MKAKRLSLTGATDFIIGECAHETMQKFQGKHEDTTATTTATGPGANEDMTKLVVQNRESRCRGPAKLVAQIGLIVAAAEQRWLH